MATVTNTLDTTADQTAAPEEVYFEIVTLDGAVYRKGHPTPHGMVTTTTGANIKTVVQSYSEVGDWIEIGLTDGYAISFPETRIARLITHTV
ncbi:hypothetical protein ACFYOY_36025 [Streptomyces sp. NPDC007875]|uniref:hypothetical protein n=1 Tax=Streptomyces sp. NPDC007875 TaxID=3364783 RepID=UPI0036C95593